MIDLARDYCYSPYKLAKLYVKHILSYNDNFSLTKLINNEVPLAPNDMTNIENNNDVSTRQDIDCAQKKQQTQRDRLKSELIRCCLEDAFSSHASETIRNCVGREFEELLYDLMRKKNMVNYYIFVVFHSFMMTLLSYVM